MRHLIAVVTLAAGLLAGCAMPGASQSAGPGGVQQSAGPWGQSVGPGGVQQGGGAGMPQQSVGPGGVRQCAGPHGPCQTVGPGGVYQGTGSGPAAPSKTKAPAAQSCQLHCSGGDVSVQCPAGKTPSCRCEPQPQALCETAR